LLTIGAIILFGIASLTANQLMVRNSEAIYNRQAEFYAMSVIQRYIGEAKAKAFDETTIVGHPVSLPSGFSATLGTDTGEAYPYFDDVDDFNGYTTTLTTNVGTMTIAISVGYVAETNLDVVVVSRTYYKKIRVTAQSNYLLGPVQADYVVTYHRNP